NALADFIAEADPGKSDPKDFLSQQQGTVQPEPETKKGSTDELFGMDSDKDNQSSADLDLPKDGLPLLILSKDEDEIQIETHAKTEDTSVPPAPPYPKSIQIQELTNQLTKLLVNSLKPELAKLLTNHDFSTSIPIELKDLPSKLSKLKFLDALPSLLNKVAKALDMLATVVDSASEKNW
ncbi:hypothetical protein Tco_1573078, partial [Tanacetum coccineum]